MVQSKGKIDNIFGISIKNYIELYRFNDSFFPAKKSPWRGLGEKFSKNTPEGEYRSICLLIQFFLKCILFDVVFDADSEYVIYFAS